MTKTSLEFGVPGNGSLQKSWPFPYEITYLIYNNLTSWNDRISFILTCRFVWVSCLAWVSKTLTVTWNTQEIRFLSLKRPCPTYLAFGIVGSIVVEYKDLSRPLSSVEIVRALKKFRKIDHIVFNAGVVLKKNEPFIVKFLTRCNDKVIIEFKNTSSNNHNNNSDSDINSLDIVNLNNNGDTDSLDHNDNNSDTSSDTSSSFLRSPIHTSPRSTSISRVLKRPIHELYVCPPSLEEEFKRRKIEAIDRGECMLRNNSIHTHIQLPPALDKLLTSNTAYHTITSIFEWDKNLIQGIEYQESVNKCIVQYVSKLVEAVLIGDLHWVLLAQVDVFFANDFSIDDCAHKRLIEPITSPKVMILECSDFGKPYYQLVIRSGQIEILAISGYYGEKGCRKKKGFMGSAIPVDMAADLLQDKNFTVNSPVNGVEYVQSVRLLRDYSKHHASLPWSFESKRFAAGGFRCCHPLEYYRIQSRLNAKSTSIEDLISLLLRIICRRTYSRESHAVILEYLLKSTDVQCAIKNSKVASHTIRTIFTALRARSTTKQGLKTVVCIFEKFEKALGKKKDVDVTSIVLVVKKEAVNLYNTYLARNIKSANIDTLTHLKG